MKEINVPKQVLTRATTAMCPECKQPVKAIPGLENPRTYKCACSWAGLQPHWGLYAPDVAGVVAEIKSWVLAELDKWLMEGYDPDIETLIPIGTLRNWSYRFNDWANRLKATNHE